MKSRYRVRRGLFGKSVLQRWVCYPLGISSSLAGTCDWVDVSYDKAPAELEAVDRQRASDALEIIHNRLDDMYRKTPPQTKGEE